MPTGVHLPDAPALLFDAAERVLARDGVAALTTRAVAAEAGVAKGVVHRYFPDFDAFLSELILARTGALEGPASELRRSAGLGTVADNLVRAMTEIFSPLAVAMVALVVTRDGLRHRLREAGAARFPMLAEGSAMVTGYLEAEQALGRVAGDADVGALSHTLIGAVHLLYTDRESGPPDARTVARMVAAVVEGSTA